MTEAQIAKLMIAEGKRANAHFKKEASRQNNMLASHQCRGCGTHISSNITTRRCNACIRKARAS